MSRDFTKNISNYMTLPSGDTAVLSGSSITAFSLWAKTDSITAGTTSNYFFAVPNPTSASNGLVAQLIAGNTLQIRGRTSASETSRSTSHSTGSTLGVWTHFGGQVDWANDLIYTVTSGVQESHATSGWTATTATFGSGVGEFRIGQSSAGTISTATQAHDGLIAHVAFWTNALLTAADWEALGTRGVLPWKVRRANLVLYRDLGGIDAVETDFISHGAVTITGSLPAGTTEPPVMLFDDSFLSNPSWMEPSTGFAIGPIAAHLTRQMAS